MFTYLRLFTIVAALGAIQCANSIAVQARATCEDTYTVVSGDTCIEIAAKFEITEAALIVGNPQIDGRCDNLFIGEQLCIPGTPSVCSDEYTVESGDICITIANKYNITVAQLESANPEIDAFCDNLQVGEVLCIP
ncbi:hypothetical protein EV361DRAFT_948213 [Lentinula raphanica]|uniref:LysM domain-containing protein n=1 Tax=Lentinula raphanica TaxID=153919 RepID=A0AA38UJW1_9AGAR|nr:hypothetical protein F5878DRAFT_262077 [Lentinula raphanica]KAJ3973116.1 hypothetical protein EV361DRAFT_948213 [Lentinula raphanica]